MISQILVADPDERPKTSDIILNSWLTKEGTEPIDLDLSSVSVSLESDDTSESSVSELGKG